MTDSRIVEDPTLPTVAEIQAMLENQRCERRRQLSAIISILYLLVLSASASGVGMVFLGIDMAVGGKDPRTVFIGLSYALMSLVCWGTIVGKLLDVKDDAVNEARWI